MDYYSPRFEKMSESSSLVSFSKLSTYLICNTKSFALIKMFNSFFFEVSQITWLFFTFHGKHCWKLFFALHLKFPREFQGSFQEKVAFKHFGLDQIFFAYFTPIYSVEPSYRVLQVGVILEANFAEISGIFVLGRGQHKQMHCHYVAFVAFLKVEQTFLEICSEKYVFTSSNFSISLVFSQHLVTSCFSLNLHPCDKISWLSADNYSS